jgi:hypothetical protein
MANGPCDMQHCGMHAAAYLLGDLQMMISHVGRLQEIPSKQVKFARCACTIACPRKDAVHAELEPGDVEAQCTCHEINVQ